MVEARTHLSVVGMFLDTALPAIELPSAAEALATCGRPADYRRRRRGRRSTSALALCFLFSFVFIRIYNFSIGL